VLVLAEYCLSYLAEVLLELVHRVGPRQPPVAALRPRRGAACAEDGRIMCNSIPSQLTYSRRIAADQGVSVPAAARPVLARPRMKIAPLSSSAP